MENPLSLLALLLSFAIFSAQASPIYCNENNYGRPTVSKCFSTIISIVTDSSVRFFVEQPLRTSPQTDWLPFIDSRPASERVPIAQLPKWWSEGQLVFLLLLMRCLPIFCYRNEVMDELELIGDCVDSCNAALVSYGPLQQQSGVTLTSWSNVYGMATQLAKNCLIDNQRGGAGILYSMSQIEKCRRCRRGIDCRDLLLCYP